MQPLKESTDMEECERKEKKKAPEKWYSVSKTFKR